MDVKNQWDWNIKFESFNPLDRRYASKSNNALLYATADVKPPLVNGTKISWIITLINRTLVGRMLISLHVLIELWYITNPEKKKVKYVGRWAQDWTIINNKCLLKKHVIGVCKDSKPQSWTSHWQNQTKRHLGSPLPTTQVQTRPKIIFSNW